MSEITDSTLRYENRHIHLARSQQTAHFAGSLWDRSPFHFQPGTHESTTLQGEHPWQIERLRHPGQPNGQQGLFLAHFREYFSKLKCSFSFSSACERDLKYAKVRFMPSARSTFGCHFNNFLAKVISG